MRKSGLFSEVFLLSLNSLSFFPVYLLFYVTVSFFVVRGMAKGRERWLGEEKGGRGVYGRPGSVHMCVCLCMRECMSFESCLIK